MMKKIRNLRRGYKIVQPMSINYNYGSSRAIDEIAYEEHSDTVLMSFLVTNTMRKKAEASIPYKKRDDLGSSLIMGSKYGAELVAQRWGSGIVIWEIRGIAHHNWRRHKAQKTY